jgi:uncharacterized phage-associated protein
MNLYKSYTKEELAKIGNAIIFLVERIPKLSKTKALKLIYIIEEISVKKYGLPFFNLKFYVWQFGPVAKDLYVEFSDSPVLLEDFIETKHSNGKTIITAKSAFNDDEFSDNEIDILELVVGTFKNYNSKKLVDYTHREHSLWHTTAEKNCVLELLETEQLNNTDIELDFADLIRNDEFKSETYAKHNEYLKTSRLLKI